jgi:uncharacterized protein
MSHGYPPMFAMLLAFIFVTMPLELSELLRRGKIRNGRIAVEGVLGYLKRVPKWQYAAFTAGFLAFALVASAPAGLLDNVVGRILSQWLPQWFFLNNTDQLASYTRHALVLTLILNLILNGFIAPVVEEMYFRGYLLPRLSRFGAAAPLINAVLFTLYHFWQPYAYISIFLVLTPYIYLVWRKQNIYFGIAAHCSLNIVGNLMLFGLIFGKVA